MNDPFVMLEWGKAHNAQDKVLMLADGLGAFRFVREIEESSNFPLSQLPTRTEAGLTHAALRSGSLESRLLRKDSIRAAPDMPW